MASLESLANLTAASPHFRSMVVGLFFLLLWLFVLAMGRRLLAEQEEEEAEGLVTGEARSVSLCQEKKGRTMSLDMQNIYSINAIHNYSGRLTS